MAKNILKNTLSFFSDKKAKMNCVTIKTKTLWTNENTELFEFLECCNVLYSETDLNSFYQHMKEQHGDATHFQLMCPGHLSAKFDTLDSLIEHIKTINKM